MNRSDLEPFRVAALGGCEYFVLDKDGEVYSNVSISLKIKDLNKWDLKKDCAVCAEWHEQQARNINPMCSSLSDSRWPQYMHYNFAIQVRKLGGWM